MAVSESFPESSTALYVLIPPSPLFAAHWSFFIPDLLDATTRGSRESDHGRRIHVADDRLNGFKLEIIRNYNVRQHRSVGSRRFAIGRIGATDIDVTDPKPSAKKAKDEDEGGG